jgi:hypothetical protein
MLSSNGREGSCPGPAQFVVTVVTGVVGGGVAVRGTAVGPVVPLVAVVEFRGSLVINSGSGCIFGCAPLFLITFGRAAVTCDSERTRRNEGGAAVEDGACTDCTLRYSMTATATAVAIAQSRASVPVRPLGGARACRSMTLPTTL